MPQATNLVLFFQTSRRGSQHEPPAGAMQTCAAVCLFSTTHLHPAGACSAGVSASSDKDSNTRAFQPEPDTATLKPETLTSKFSTPQKEWTIFTLPNDVSHLSPFPTAPSLSLSHTFSNAIPPSPLQTMGKTQEKKPADSGSVSPHCVFQLDLNRLKSIQLPLTRTLPPSPMSLFVSALRKPGLVVPIPIAIK